MTRTSNSYLLFIPAIIFAIACTGNADKNISDKKDSTSLTRDQHPAYPPGFEKLYDTIVRMDSILFHAYNTCDTNTYSSLFSEDLEFYHDMGGLETDKRASVESYIKNVCGRVTRELKKGSIEVSPVARYGAVEIGMHRFHNSREPNAESNFARFIIIWKRDNENWKITRVISLH